MDAYLFKEIASNMVFQLFRVLNFQISLSKVIQVNVITNILNCII